MHIPELVLSPDPALRQEFDLKGERTSSEPQHAFGTAHLIPTDSRGDSFQQEHRWQEVEVNTNRYS